MLFLKYQEAQGRLNSMTEYEMFAAGFRMGAQLMFRDAQIEQIKMISTTRSVVEIFNYILCLERFNDSLVPSGVFFTNYRAYYKLALNP